MRDVRMPQAMKGDVGKLRGSGLVGELLFKFWVTDGAIPMRELQLETPTA